MISSYTGVVTVTGEGRNGGRASADDGFLDTTLAIPKELGGAGGAPNPEQLVAAGWGACLLGSVRRAATRRNVRLTSTSVTVELTLNHNSGDDFTLEAVINLELGGVDEQTAAELGAAAERICPYSKSVRDSMPVTFRAYAAA
ncbi:Ohr family peroxiredoxin [Nonomuraea sp. NN258]|uniref:Ohr family peroxiredoxin n=1 Tax=Nonomuraea antri TaxID=2730852 RepID=UPI001569CF1D|nr:Ohr family peroxiredoxin [Nonomuraea antri]NRQ31861.1 Ohr family peroxiredoxin [Nonomuraea antri]